MSDRTHFTPAEGPYAALTASMHTALEVAAIREEVEALLDDEITLIALDPENDGTAIGRLAELYFAQGRPAVLAFQIRSLLTAGGVR